MKGEVISSLKVQIANRVAGELKSNMQKNVVDAAHGIEMTEKLLCSGKDLEGEAE